MFTSILVPLDLEELGDRTLPFVHRLARAGSVPVELLTISAPGMSQASDIFELEQRVKAMSDVDCHVAVRSSDDAAATILEVLEGQPGALLAMATHARWVLGERLFGSVSEPVLARHTGPTVLFGPSACWTAGDGPLPLVIGVHRAEHADALLDMAETWVGTFDGSPAWLVEVVDAPSPGHQASREAQQRVRRLADGLRARGIEAHPRALTSSHPADALADFADRLGDTVIALGSERWTDRGRRHLGSVARSVAHDGRHPVLVVPVRPAT